MLQQLQTEERTENYASENYAAKTRVTPQELTEAVTRIEMRHAAATHETLDTLTLGEAVDHLRLDSTPEELLAEVRAIRESAERSAAAQTVGETPPQSRRAKWSRRMAGAALVVSLAANGALFAACLSYESLAAHSRSVANMSNANGNPQETYYSTSFKEMQDDHAFTITTEGLMNVANNQKRIEVHNNSTPEPHSKFIWRGKKWRSKAWIAGWVKKGVTDAAIKSGAFEVSSMIKSNTNGQYRSVKIPIERFKDLPELPTHFEVGDWDAQTLLIPAAK